MWKRSDEILRKILIVRKCVKIKMSVKKVLSVNLHIITLNNYIILIIIKNNIAKSIWWKENANLMNFVLWLILKKNWNFILFIWLIEIKILWFFYLKVNFVHLVNLNMIDNHVFMHIIGKILRDLLIII